MLVTIAAYCRRHALGAVLGLATACVGAPLAAQGMQTIDPNSAIDADLNSPPTYDTAPSYDTTPAPAYDGVPTEPAPWTPEPAYPQQGTVPNNPATSQVPVQAANASAQSDTYKEDDLIGAAEGVFGKGAKGLAGLIEDILKKQGEPNGYIVGREAGGAFFVGARYGSGTLFHKIEGQRPVYWTGPSIGFDAGANAGSTFVLVYNLNDTEELYERYPAGEGAAYFVGGFNASYMRKGDVVLIPIRVGAGLRLGVNAGYMKFSKDQRWLPF
ncbi:MAG: DUF1134 domain-containing protein [Porphyrobacter sp.]|nr:DUF1134 domain-containing protein [Porphyrobacter sp.]